MKNLSLKILLLCLSVLSLVGRDTTKAKSKQLARLQKIGLWLWSLASQVIPVYPLTEDLLPGDVFLSPPSIMLS